MPNSAAAWYAANLRAATLPPPRLARRCSLADLEAARALAGALCSEVAAFCRGPLLEMWCAGVFRDLATLAALARRLLATLLAWQRTVFRSGLLPAAGLDPVARRRLLTAGVHLLTSAELYAACDAVRPGYGRRQLPLFANDCPALRSAARQLAGAGLALAEAALHGANGLHALRAALLRLGERLPAAPGNARPLRTFPVRRPPALLRLAFEAPARGHPEAAQASAWAVHHLGGVARLIADRLGLAQAFLERGLGAGAAAQLLDVALAAELRLESALGPPAQGCRSCPATASHQRAFPYPCEVGPPAQCAARADAVRLQLRVARAVFRALRTSVGSGADCTHAVWTRDLLGVVEATLERSEAFTDRQLRPLVERALGLARTAVEELPRDLERLLSVDLATGRMATHTELDPFLSTPLCRRGSF